MRTVHDRSATAPSTAIVEAIATAEGVDPVALATDEDTPLYDHVDPDALDTLVTDKRANGVTLTVAIDGYSVRIARTELIVEPTGTWLRWSCVGRRPAGLLVQLG